MITGLALAAGCGDAFGTSSGSGGGGGAPHAGGHGGRPLPTSTGHGGRKSGTGGHGGVAGQAGFGGLGGVAGAAGSGGAAGAAGSGGTAGAAGFAGGGGPPTYDLHSADRDGCVFGAGDVTTDTIGPDVPHGDAMPFQHVIVLMFENRSFDHWFSNLPAYGVPGVDVADDTYANPDPTPPQSFINRYHESRYCIFDTDHEWEATHLQYDNGAMDGFVATNNPGGGRAMGYYTEADIGYEYWLAASFGVGDRYFASLLGPTWPNRFYFYGATSWGNTVTGGVPPLNNTKIVNELDTAGRTWQIYHDGLTSFGILFGPQYAGTDITAFESDVANDALPDLSIIDPNFMGADENDDHPPSNIQLGQQFLARIVDALWSNQAVWQNSVLFVTFDEHGGYYDHVPPPPACVPDGDAPADFAFDRYGIRVPLMVISPFTRAGYVSHFVTDHTSITRFIENRFDLPAMTARDANAWPLLDYFDFANPPQLTSPSGEPDATPDPAGIDWCANNPPGTGTF